MMQIMKVTSLHAELVKTMAKKDKDWLLFREKIGKWQEAYMEKLCQEYIQLLSSDVPASNRFHTIEKRIYTDRKSEGVVVDMTPSLMARNLAGLIECGAITMEDLSEFSEFTRDRVQVFLNFRKD